MPFIHGTKIALIGSDEFLVRCPCCEANSWAEIMVICKYYSVYWVPFCPVSKEANITCTKCGLKRDGRAFDADLVNNYNEIKSKFKHPWYAYIGVTIMACIAGLIILRILFELFSNTGGAKNP